MRNEIAQMWIRLGMLYGRHLDKQSVEIMLEAISDLKPETVLGVMRKWVATEGKFPMPSDIRSRITPELSTRDHAIDAVNAAIACVARFGSWNQTDSKLTMGELAWEAVHRFGGWKHLCESLTIENEGIIRAQLRELAEVVFKKSQRGELHQTAQLPQSEEIKNLVSATIKAIG